MKIIFNIISVIIVILVVVLATVNIQTFFNLTVFGVDKMHLTNYYTNLSPFILWVFVAGILAGTFWAGSFYFPVQKKLKEYQRKLEKTSVQSDEESSKVEVLEAKIATLEKALQSALENSQ